MNVYEWKNFSNIGFLSTRLTDSELQPVKEEIEHIKNNFYIYDKYNSTLAGNIEHEYRLVKSKKYIETLVTPYINAYEEVFKYLENITILDKNLSLGLSPEPWVNFQKKHEFNPPHTHSGIYSFVIWMDIPYNMEEELKQNHSKNSNAPIPGHFQFLYTSALGEIVPYNIPADKTYNNTLLVFPCKMFHEVYPFSTSDEYRISVSGNFKLIV